MEFRSKDYGIKKPDTDQVAFKTGILVILTGIIGIFNPVVWIATLKIALRSLYQFALGESGKLIKGGSKILFNDKEFVYQEIENGYLVTIPYCDVESISIRDIFFIKELLVNLKDNRILKLASYEDVESIIYEFEKKCCI